MAIRIPLVVINGRLKELPVGDKFHNEVLSTFVFEQIIPSDIWVINHNMQKWPSVSIVLFDGSKVYATVVYISEDQVEIRFSKPQVGKAFLN